MRKIVVIASAVAVFALAALTLAPVVYSGRVEQVARVSATQFEASESLCATVEVEFSLGARVFHPVLDIWNASHVRDVEVSDLKVSTAPAVDCAGVPPFNEELTSLDTYVLIANPHCANPFEAGQEERDSHDVGVFERCGGDALSLVLRGESISTKSLSIADARGLGASSAVVFGDRWCLDVQAGVVFVVGTSNWHGGGDSSYVGEACLPLR